MNITQDTLQLIKGALGNPSDVLGKTITTSTGLVAYDLQAPAKNLYPVVTPIRNRLPRVGGIVLAPFMLVGAWVRRRSVDFGPFLTYAVVLFTFSAIVSAVHVPGGTFIHSASALAPHSYVLAPEGIAAAAGWVATRRRSWDAGRASRVFGGAAFAFALVVGLAGTLSIHITWDRGRQELMDVATALDEAGSPPSDRVMSIDAASTRYWTGHGGVVLVNDPLATIEQVARAYDIRWLILDRSDAVPAVAPILDGDARPTWVGPALIDSRGIDARVQWGLYPVCTSAGDSRCSAATAERSSP